LTIDNKNYSKELTIRRNNPFSLFQEMDRLFDKLTRDVWPFGWRRFPRLSLAEMEDEPIFRTPLANISEEKDNYVIICRIARIK
jgi:HSP20 family molecular chaperone IbpA